MFTAMIFACWLHSPNECTQFIDKRGPYLNEGDCSIRVVQMIEEIRNITPGKIIVGAKCTVMAQEST